MNERAEQRMLALQKSPRIGGDMQWRMPFGASSAGNWIAMQAQRRTSTASAPRKETLGWIALNARKNAARTPWAIYKEPLTMDDYLNARTITTPFGLYDCDVPCDGAVAVIVSRKDLAGDMKQPPVHLEAVGTAITERMSWDQGTLDHEPLVHGPGRAPLDPHRPQARRHRHGPALRRLLVQLPVVDRGARLLRLGRGEGLPRRRQEHRPRRHAAAQHPRRPALVGPPARLRLHPRGGHAAARRTPASVRSRTRRPRS